MSGEISSRRGAGEIDMPHRASTSRSEAPPPAGTDGMLEDVAPWAGSPHPERSA